MKRLLKYLNSYKKECVLGPLFKMFEASLELIVPLVIASIVDKGIKGASPSYVVKACLFLLLLGAVGLAFSLTAQYFSARAAVGFVGKLRYALFEKVGSLSYSDLDELGTSTIITRMTQDASKVQNGLNLTLRLLLRSPFVVFGAMIMAFTVDVKSALIFLGVIPLLSIVVFGIMLITMPLYKKAQKGTDKLLGRTRENLSGVRVIRAFGNEEKEISQFCGENDTLTVIQRRVGRISALMNPLTYILINIAILLLIHTGAIQVSLKNLTQGEVVALYNYMSQILVELIKLANLIISITFHHTGQDRCGAVGYDIRTDLLIQRQRKGFALADLVTERIHKAGSIFLLPFHTGNIQLIAQIPSGADKVDRLLAHKGHLSHGKGRVNLGKIILNRNGYAIHRIIHDGNGIHIGRHIVINGDAVKKIRHRISGVFTAILHTGAIHMGKGQL